MNINLTAKLGAYTKGMSPTVDKELDITSTNVVENKVIAKAINETNANVTDLLNGLFIDKKIIFNGDCSLMWYPKDDFIEMTVTGPVENYYTVTVPDLISGTSVCFKTNLFPPLPNTTIYAPPAMWPSATIDENHQFKISQVLFPNNEANSVSIISGIRTGDQLLVEKGGFAVVNSIV